MRSLCPASLTQRNSIGAGCARDLFSQGCSLALTYSSNKGAVDTLITELRSTASQDDQRKATAHQADMSREEDLTRLYTEIKAQHGQAGPDILVANAGYGKRTSNILDISFDEWDYTINVCDLLFPICSFRLVKLWRRLTLHGIGEPPCELHPHQTGCSTHDRAELGSNNRKFQPSFVKQRQAYFTQSASAV